MSRTNGPVWRAFRRLGLSILEVGEELQKRAYAPGQHGSTKRVRLTNCGQQLHEKQKTRYMYGLSERQFRNAFVRASKVKGVTDDNFLDLLGSRLDSLVYRMGFVHIRRAAHQLVNRGHVLVNGKKADISSSTVKSDTAVEIRERFRDMKAINETLEATLNTVAFIDIDKDAKKSTYLRLPECNELNSESNELLVVGFYNR